MIKAILVSGIVAATWTGGVDLMISRSDAGSLTQPAAKGDRLDIRPRGAGCDQEVWPYYSSSCVQKNHDTEHRTTEVRVVSADRLTNTNPAVQRVSQSIPVNPEKLS